jgi:hypothetical protein
MEIVGELKGHARVLAGWNKFDGIRYRIDVWEEKHRRRIEIGAIEADPDVIMALYEYGEATIDLGGLGQFGFVVTDAKRGEIRIIGPVMRSEEEDPEWRSYRVEDGPVLTAMPRSR